MHVSVTVVQRKQNLMCPRLPLPDKILVWKISRGTPAEADCQLDKEVLPSAEVLTVTRASFRLLSLNLSTSWYLSWNFILASLTGSKVEDHSLLVDHTMDNMFVNDSRGLFSISANWSFLPFLESFVPISILFSLPEQLKIVTVPRFILVNWWVSLPQFHGFFWKTWDSWIRNKGHHYSWQ